ncbi:TPA: hypothetical protein ENG04_00165 [Candidatus Poribacteria bacterium]|nr:hypothetical protein [Candidatus Poribacteria bacterium]HEX28479.1 hypothetical protein [Candidatus Poribacteria bacterium]
MKGRWALKVTLSVVALVMCSLTWALDYYPVKLGMRWRYEVQEKGGSYVQIVTIPRSDKIDGKRVFIQEVRKAEDGSRIVEKAWLLPEKEGVKLVKSSSYDVESSTVTPLKPLTIIKEPLKLGDRWDKRTNGKVRITGLIPQIGRYTIDIDVLWISSFKAEKEEAIPDARGGRIYKCIKLIEETKLTVKGIRIDASNESVKSFILQNTSLRKGNVLKYQTVKWLAPGVGPVKVSETFIFPGQPVRRRVKKLIDFHRP